MERPFIILFAASLRHKRVERDYQIKDGVWRVEQDYRGRIAEWCSDGGSSAAARFNTHTIGISKLQVLYVVTADIAKMYSQILLEND